MAVAAAGAAGAAVVAAAAAAAASPQRQEIDQLYAEHDPEKLPEVDKLVGKYGEDRLLRMVRRKFRTRSVHICPPCSDSPTSQRRPPARNL